MRVVVDTSVLLPEFISDSSNLHVLLEGCQRTGHSLFVPEVVLQELLSECTRTLRQLARQVGSAVKVMNALTGSTMSCPVGDDNIQALSERCERDVASRLHFAGASYLHYADIPHNVIMRRALSRKKPFKEGGAGYRDTLIWECILKLAREEGEPIAFVSANTKDFADDKGNLHPDLQKDVASLGDNRSEVTLYTSLARFIQDHVKPALEAVESVRSQLARGEYPDLDLVTFLTDELPSFIGGVEFEPKDVGLPPECESVTLTSVEEIGVLNVHDVRRLTESVLLIELTAPLDASFDSFVFKADYYCMPEEEQPEAWEPDWNEHYVACSAVRSIWLELGLTFDVEKKRVTSAEVLAALPSEQGESCRN